MPVSGSKTDKKIIGIEKRASILYVRVKPTNRAWVKAQAEEQSITESQCVDELLEKLRNDPSYGKKF